MDRSSNRYLLKCGQLCCTEKIDITLLEVLLGNVTLTNPVTSLSKRAEVNSTWYNTASVAKWLMLFGL